MPERPVTSLEVIVDMGLCESHGQCVFAAPQVFAFDEDDVLVYEPAPDVSQYDKVVAAAAACPVRAIRIERTTEGGAHPEAATGNNPGPTR
ncbi:ferredoxin [Actinacidiphila glaucinigra]|uniref:ferredoxin n=1 Tax=Actinacidiphila glaucinigra TaxID=235986 RepID=UPI002DD8B52D|nr:MULTISPECIES: ferredoxin [Streptomycetaceae]WSD57470.1 ferredoxin [Actinacidiphila glaucinigra]WSD65175.1 ferredoxin [Actinacidiphila glaucinigra]WUB50252.1 ferredoxin [Streptomyces griseorubiginosus]